MCNSNADLLRLVGANFDYKVAFYQKNEAEKFDNSEKFAEKKFVIFCFICLSLLTFELLNINWKCSENCNMLTERTYDSAVFKIFSRYYNDLHFYWAIINWNFIWNIDLNNGVYCDLRNKGVFLNRVLYILLTLSNLAVCFICTKLISRH